MCVSERVLTQQSVGLGVLKVASILKDLAFYVDLKIENARIDRHLATTHPSAKSETASRQSRCSGTPWQDLSDVKLAEALADRGSFQATSRPIRMRP